MARNRFRDGCCRPSTSRWALRSVPAARAQRLAGGSRCSPGDLHGRRPRPFVARGVRAIVRSEAPPWTTPPPRRRSAPATRGLLVRPTCCRPTRRASSRVQITPARPGVHHRGKAERSRTSGLGFPDPGSRAGGTMLHDASSKHSRVRRLPVGCSGPAAAMFLVVPRREPWLLQNGTRGVIINQSYEPRRCLLSHSDPVRRVASRVDTVRLKAAPCPNGSPSRLKRLRRPRLEWGEAALMDDFECDQGDRRRAPTRLPPDKVFIVGTGRESDAGARSKPPSGGGRTRRGTRCWCATPRLLQEPDDERPLFVRHYTAGRRRLPGCRCCSTTSPAVTGGQPAAGGGSRAWRPIRTSWA